MTLCCVPARWKMVDHYVSRLGGTMQLLQQHDIIGRTSELARVFGIQFYHVLTRGSQVRNPPDLRNVGLLAVVWIGTLR